mgnify:CR=1 FL=1
MINLAFDSFKCCVYSSDVDPDWLYADQDPQNLMNPDPFQIQIQVNKITKLNSKLLKFKKSFLVLLKPSANKITQFQWVLMVEEVIDIPLRGGGGGTEFPKKLHFYFQEYLSRARKIWVRMARRIFRQRLGSLQEKNGSELSSWKAMTVLKMKPLLRQSR